jgi:hypothetical protein
MSRRTRTLRYGASIAVVLAGIACGAIIPGSAGGTGATVLVGIGLVGVVSLLFYEVGLTEDRERAARQGSEERAWRETGAPGEAGASREPGAPREAGAPAAHQGGRIRPLERRRGQRRRLH